MKSSSGDAGGPFQISENEWSRATEAHHNQHEEYLIYRVAHVKDKDAQDLVDVIRDPYALKQEAKLTLLADDFWAYVGKTSRAEKDSDR